MDHSQFEDIPVTKEGVQKQAPILDLKDFAAPSVFLPENMLREAKRQKSIREERIPPVCVLDPDGDFLRYLQENDYTTPCKGWACFHSVMHEFSYCDIQFGIVGCAVGAAFAVLIAEQAFVSGCELLISISSAGRIAGDPSDHFILIERAIRDEGTSYHYLAPSRYAEADSTLTIPVFSLLRSSQTVVHLGSTWTTDAPFRETERAIVAARVEGILAVEMEAAALYAFAAARKKKVLCFAQITNEMGQVEGDFQKSEATGICATFELIALTVRAIFSDPG